MGRLHFAVALSCAGVLLTAPALDGGEPLRMRLSPAISTAPGSFTVQVNVAAAPDNRALQVIAESPEFYRSSEVSLDGASAAALNVFEFRNLPSGRYEVRGVLLGKKGPRATVWGLAQVQPLGR